MTQAVFALCPLLCSSQAAWLCKLLSNRSLSGSRSPLCACLFAQYIAESSTKEPGYLKELYVTKSHTVCHHNTCMRRPQTHWALTQGGRRLAVKITDGTVWVNAWAMWVLLTKLYSKKKKPQTLLLLFFVKAWGSVSCTCGVDRTQGESQLMGAKWTAAFHSGSRMHSHAQVWGRWRNEKGESEKHVVLLLFRATQT